MCIHTQIPIYRLDSYCLMSIEIIYRICKLYMNNNYINTCINMISSAFHVDWDQAFIFFGKTGSSCIWTLGNSLAFFPIVNITGVPQLFHHKNESCPANLLFFSPTPYVLALKNCWKLFPSMDFYLNIPDILLFLIMMCFSMVMLPSSVLFPVQRGCPSHWLV